MACVLIASKIEEELLPVSRILKVFYPMYLHRTGQQVEELNETDAVCWFIYDPTRFMSIGEMC